ncbi:hypothetical protein DAEQUDRAFT_725219 [Daedalea quercina L-15889]|uniref:Uncharacterized protein n=1 Tax=Daedalea quercina L-15889 TaxID=1314783 RepID=A0A165RF28_9APHY|nr:hypothetical protein DAEQUDRAFT_725219 [Daedalea quercina L-15889]
MNQDAAANPDLSSSLAMSNTSIHSSGGDVSRGDDVPTTQGQGSTMDSEPSGCDSRATRAFSSFIASEPTEIAAPLTAGGAPSSFPPERRLDADADGPSQSDDTDASSVLTKRKRPRHPRARGGKKVQEAKARKLAKQAAQAALEAALSGSADAAMDPTPSEPDRDAAVAAMEPRANRPLSESVTDVARQQVAPDHDEPCGAPSVLQRMQATSGRKRRRPRKGKAKAAVAAALVKQSQSFKASHIQEAKARATPVQCQSELSSGTIAQATIPLLVSDPSLIDEPLSSNGHHDSSTTEGQSESSLVLSRPERSPSGLQLSDSHQDLLLTLFPHGDPGAHEDLDVHRPLLHIAESVKEEIQEIQEAAEETLSIPADERDPDTLAYDLAATQREISGLKKTVSVLLTRMDSVCDGPPLSRAARRRARKSREGEHVEDEAQCVLGALLEDLEKISVLTVQLAAVVQSEAVSSL